MTAGAATALASARMVPLAMAAAPFGRGWLARAIVAALLVAAVVPSVMAQPDAAASALPTEILVGVLLGLVAALPFAAAQAAGLLVDAAVHPWQARRSNATRERGPLGEAYLLFALALFAVVDGPRLVAVAAGQSYVAWPIGQAPSSEQVIVVGVRLVAAGVSVAAPALAAMLVAELLLVLIARAQPAIGRAVDAAPLRALAVLLVAAGGVYAAAHALAPVMNGATHLQVSP